MGDLLPGKPISNLLPSHAMRGWLELVLGTPVILWGGRRFFERFWLSLKNRSLNMFTMIGLGTGGLVVEATRVGADTLLSQIVHMVAEAQRSRAPIQKLADRAAAYFVPTVVLTALGTFAVWAVLSPEPAMTYALINSVAVLIIACPCALGVADPIKESTPGAIGSRRA